MSFIASNLKRKISEKNISVLSLERSAGIKTGSIQNILYGRSKHPNVNMMLSLAKALDCGIDELVSPPPAQGSHFFTTEPEIWQKDLYCKCMSQIASFIVNANLDVDKKNILQIIDEVYSYSVENTLKTPDERFMKWYISRLT